mgnify:CR=1 FL=1
MLNFIRNIFTSRRGSLKLALLTVMIFANVFFTRAAVSGASVGDLKFYFRFDSAAIDPDYLENRRTIALLDSLVAAGALDAVRDLQVVTYSSPEGAYLYNVDLSARRASSMNAWLAKRYPQLAGVVSEHPGAETWSDFRAAIVSDSALSERAREGMLALIDSDIDPDQKFARIKTYRAYQELYSKYFRRFRYAEFKLISLGSESGAPQPVQDTLSLPVEPAQELEPAAEPVAELAVEQLAEPAVEPATEPEMEPVEQAAEQLAEPAAEPAAKPLAVPARKTVAALRTNLLYDAVTAVNFELELPVGKRFSVMAEDVFPWWETGNKYCFQIWEMGLEGRCWLKPWDVRSTEKLQGWFGGVYAMSGRYDLQWDKSLNRQGEFWSTGVTAGYSKAIGRKKNINLEFSLSLGYLRSPFRYYQPTDDYQKLIHYSASDGVQKYFGPTKAKVSLVIPITVPVSWKKEVSHE